MAHNIPTSVYLRGWGSPSLHRWTCAAVLTEVAPGATFLSLHLDQAVSEACLLSSVNPLSGFSLQIILVTQEDPVATEGHWGQRSEKVFHYEAVLLLDIMGWGAKRGEWEDALNTHSFLLVFYLPSLCFPITSLPLILSLWVPLFVSGQSEAKHKNVALGQARA